jgi:hypothetical protein
MKMHRRVKMGNVNVQKQEILEKVETSISFIRQRLFYYHLRTVTKLFCFSLSLCVRSKVSLLRFHPYQACETFSCS